jgi:hypothetical protein
VRREPRPILLAILAIAAFVTFAMPRPVAACSCAPPGAILETAATDPTIAVFTAVVGPSLGTETSLSVTRWFQGGGPGLAFVVLDVQVGDGAGCGTSTPPAGGEYLFAMPLEGNRGGLSLCSMMADTSTAEGQAMLATASELGEPIIPSVTAPPGAGGPSPTPGDADPTPTGLVVSMLGAVAPLGVAIAFGLGLIGGLVLILRRREARPPE